MRGMMMARRAKIGINKGSSTVPMTVASARSAVSSGASSSAVRSIPA